MVRNLGGDLHGPAALFRSLERSISLTATPDDAFLGFRTHEAPDGPSFLGLTSRRTTVLKK